MLQLIICERARARERERAKERERESERMMETVVGRENADNTHIHIHSKAPPASTLRQSHSRASAMPHMLHCGCRCRCWGADQ